VKNSPSLATIAQLGTAQLRLHDPAVTIEKHEIFQKPIEAAQGADALMILTPWPEYRAIAPADIARAMRGKTVLDPYAILERARAKRAGLEVHTLGRRHD
jgi:UDPglucose 6-dehydrogenase